MSDRRAKEEKIRCDACPVMCYIAEGKPGACDRYANHGGELVRLRDVADISLERASNLIARENSQRKAVVSLNVAEGANLGHLVEEVASLDGPGARLEYDAASPGAYHVELWVYPEHLREALGDQEALADTEYLWVISNPIFVEG